MAGIQHEDIDHSGLTGVPSSNPQFTTIELGHASDTTIARASAGNLTVEGNALYRAGGTDVAVADGGTGSSTASAARTALDAQQTLSALSLSDVGTPASGDLILLQDVSASSALKVAQFSTFGGGSSGAMTQIADTTLGATATNITFSSIANSYNHLLVLVQARSDRAGTVFEGVNIQFNTDTGSNYDSVNPDFSTSDAYADSVGATSGFLASIPAADAPAGAAGTFEIRINNYKATVFHKSYFTNGTVKYGTSSGNIHTVVNSGHWRSTAAITEVKILTRNGSNFIVGTRATLYGIT